MRKKCLSLAISLIVSCLPFALEAQKPLNLPTGQVTVTDHLDWEMLKRKQYFGYTEQEIKKWFDVPLQYDYDYAGYASALVKSPPPAGVHPRVAFYEEDLPALRTKLSTTDYGMASMNAMRTFLNKKLTGANADFVQAYNNLIAGNQDPKLSNLEFGSAIVYELFRCLIDKDTKAAKDATAALTTMAIYQKAELDKLIEKAEKKNGKDAFYDYQEARLITLSGVMGLGYDFAFNWMTDTQKETVRATLIRATTHFTFIGCETLPAFPANTSNWIPMHTPIIYLCAAVEGEAGYDPSTLARATQAYKNYLGAGFFPEGEMFESMGKNFLCAANLIPMANRGEQLLALKKIRKQIGHYYLHALDVWGGNKISFFDSLGGSGNEINTYDVMIIKRMFPNDPKIDYVYRNAVGEDYRFYKEQIHIGHPMTLMNGLIKTIYCTPYLDKTLAQAKADAIADEKNTYYSTATGNVIARSSWDDKAVVMHSLTRQIAGGHVYSDRSHVSVYGLGRYFSIYKPLRQIDEHYSPKHRNVILIDGKGCGWVAARGVAFVDNADATFSVTDTKPSYDFTTDGNNRFPKKGIVPPYTANYFRIQKSDLPWMDMPYGDLPFWQTAKKGSESWLPNLPVQKAFRTAGLVRGKHSYVLICDDIKKDDSVHQYQFGTLLADDLLLKNSTISDNGKKGFTNDAVFAAKGENRNFLVRVLSVNGNDPKKASIELDPYQLSNPPQKSYSMNRIVINSQSVEPNFKTLYFPFMDGEPLPTTVWNANKTILKIEWPDQQDEIQFSKLADGRTGLVIKRGDKAIVEVK